MSIWAWEIGSKGFLLTPGDRTHCGGYILSNENGCTVKGMVIACEGDVYICGLDSQRYQIEGGVPDGSWIEAGSNLFRDTWKSPFYDDIDPQGRKIIPHSEGLKRLHEDTGLQRRSYDSLRSVNEKFEHDEFIGTVGGIFKGRKRIITGEKKNIHSTLNMNTGYRTRIAKNLFDSYLRMGRDLSNYETEIICLLAGSAHSRGSCKCHCRFIPRLNITYRYDRFIISSYQSANTPEKPISAPVLARRIPRTRQSVEPGFCVVPDQTTPKSYERELMVNPLSGVRELYRLLNPEKNKKPGSILIVADPEQQNLQKIQTLQKARDKIDKALAPLTTPEAKLLYENRQAVNIFSSQIYSDALGTSGDILGYIKDTGGGYYEEINKTLNDIQKLYKKTYSSNTGRISGEEFFGQRDRLFKKLEGILNKFSKEQLNLKQYEDIKQALGLSTKSIMHKWDQTGVSDIEGYASYIEKSAKLIKIMKTTGYAGVGLDFASYTTNVYDACAKGRESECRKAAITEYSKFGGKQTASLAGGAAGGIMGRAACTWVLRLVTSEGGGFGAGLCLVTGIGSSIAGGEIMESIGEKLGEGLAGIVNNDINDPEIKLRNPDSFNEKAGFLIYEKIFNR